MPAENYGIKLQTTVTHYTSAQGDYMGGTQSVKKAADGLNFSDLSGTRFIRQENGLQMDMETGDYVHGGFFGGRAFIAILDI